MVVYIKKGNVLYFNVCYDENYFFEKTNFEKKSNLLNKALENLEKDINKLAQNQINNEFYNFFWEFTYDIHRDDGIKNTVADYYLLEILKDIKDEYSIERIEVEIPLNKNILLLIQKVIGVNLTFKKHVRDDIRGFIRRQVGASKYILKYLRHSLRLKKDSLDVDYKNENSTFFLTNDTFNNTRYKGFYKTINEKNNVYFLNLSLTKLKKYSNGIEYYIKSYSIKLLIISFFKTIMIFRNVRANLKKEKVKSLYLLKLKSQSFLQMYYLVLRHKTLEKVFSIYSPKWLFTTTTIGDPLKRMVITLAKKNNVNSVVFSCRSVLSYLRAEDRVIGLDFNNETGDFFVDYFICFDKISRQHLVAAGVDNNKIFTLNDNDVSAKNHQTTFTEGIVLLFAHQRYNDNLIDLMERAILKGVEVGNLYYREHPSVKISDKQLGRLKRINNSVICLTNYSWNQLNFTNVIALSSNSTSGIDISSRGASIVWLPFLTEHSTQFKPMMDALGKTCNDEYEFVMFLSTLNEEKKKLFNENCERQFYDNIYEKNDINNFF